MPYLERTDEELMTALRSALAEEPGLDRVALGGQVYTWPQFCEMAKAINFLELIRQLARERNDDPIVVIGHKPLFC